MNKQMNMITKLKTVEESCCINYEWGAIKIKEATDVESPVAIIPFPIGRVRRGVARQRQYAKLLSAAPELLEKLDRLVEVIGPLKGEILKFKYAGVVSAWKEAKELINYLEDEEV